MNEEYKAIEQEDVNEIFDTCIFDSIVEGYLISVMEELEYSTEAIAKALDHLQVMFNDLGASEVLAIREGFISIAKEDGLIKEG